MESSSVSGGGSSSSAYYNFHPLINLKFPGFEQTSTIEYLKKWSLHDGLAVQGFSFDAPYKPYLLKQFVQDFFENNGHYSGGGNGDHHGNNGNNDLLIQFDLVPCTQTSMSLFDKILSNSSILYTSSTLGTIRKCTDQYVRPAAAEAGGGGDPILVSNQLQKMLLKWDGQTTFENEYDYDDEEASDRDDEVDGPAPEVKVKDNKSKLTLEERSEFLYKLFHHLVIGGSLCQYEDIIQPYLATTKCLYKDLISVSAIPPADKKGGTNQCEREEVSVRVNTIVAHIKSIHHSGGGGGGGGNLLFPKPNYNNFCYLLISPDKRTCYTLTHRVGVL